MPTPLIQTEKPARTDMISHREAVAAGIPEVIHQEVTRDGVRLVYDWMFNADTQHPVLRGVNMTTGKMLWWRLPEDV